MNEGSLKHLTETVQYNCHVSDARHATDYPLCTYLMKMREYYRWERAIPLGAPLPRGEVADWLQARERLWEDLDEAELRPLDIDGVIFDPFDAGAVNEDLLPRGLVYSGGIGNGGKAHFLLGRLERCEQVGEYRVAVVSSEYARELAAPPAMIRGQQIILRRESLRRLLWEKLEGWRWSRPANALGRAFAYYDFESDLVVALNAMTGVEIETLRLHEVGEHQAGILLGDRWEEMLFALLRTPAELMLRAVRDHLADCLSTLPALIERDNPASLHFYFGNLTPLRKDLFPALEAAYHPWAKAGERASLLASVSRGRLHWLETAERALGEYQRQPEGAAGRIRALIEGVRL